MKKTHITIFIFAFILVGGFLIWYVGSLNISQDIKEVAQNNNADILNNEEDQDENENGDSAEIEEIVLPVDFEILIDKNPDLRDEMKQALKDQFKVVVEKINMDSSSARNWIDLGAIKHALMDYKGAEQAWIFSTQINPFATGAYANLGQLYWHKLPDFKKAEEMFIKFLEINTFDQSTIRIYRDLSDLYRYDYKEKEHLADDVLLEGLGEYPDNPDLISYLARYYYETGNKEEAIKYYEKYLSINPDDQSAKEYLNDLLN